MSDTTTTNHAPGEVGQSRKNDWYADPARLQSIREHGEPKSIGIVGSRRRKSKDDYHQLYDALRAIYNDGDYIVSGGCPQGGDFFAEQIARRLGTSIIIHHADWERHGRSAGFKRNGKIALDADILIALVADDRRGGTEDTIRKYLDMEKGNLIILEAGEKSPAPAPVVMVEETPAQEPEPPAAAAVVVNIKQPYDVYIGRRGHGQDGYFGNPHPVGKPCQLCGRNTHTREEAIEAYREDFNRRIESDDTFRQRVKALAGKRLGCFCAPRPCHGDVIVSYLNRA